VRVRSLKSEAAQESRLKPTPCPNCESHDQYRSKEVGAGGGHAPNYLPGLGKWYAAAKFTVVVCRSCGLTRFFASEEARANLTDTEPPTWTRIG
jgi:predicted nucleic-acid-binding Zn-ribbon protein